MIETGVDGDPAALRAAAGFLRDLAAGLDRLAGRVAAERVAALDDWEGEAARAFAERADVLAGAGDELVEVLQRVGRRVEELAADLEYVQDGMARLRDLAQGSGMPVIGTTIGWPTLSAALLGIGGGPLEPALTYDEAQDRARELRERWVTALARTADAVRLSRFTMVQLAAGLLTDGYRGLARGLSGVLREQSELLYQRSAEAVSDMARIRSDLLLGRVTPSAAAEAELLELERRAGDAAAEARDHATGANRHDLTRLAARGIGPALALYGVYDDVQHGESLGQAVTSQAAGVGGGALGALLCGLAATPAAPGLGTALGIAACAAGGSLAGGLLGDAAYVAARDRLRGPPPALRAPGPEQGGEHRDGVLGDGAVRAEEQLARDERRVLALLAAGRA